MGALAVCNMKLVTHSLGGGVVASVSLDRSDVACDVLRRSLRKQYQEEARNAAPDDPRFMVLFLFHTLRALGCLWAGYL